MPFLPIQTESGLVEFSYHISTPEETSATEINPDLPTVVCFHSVYIAQSIFHAQFADPQLRRFNLISFDARGHGQTRGPIPGDYTPKNAAADLRLLLNALDVQKSHLLSVSLGSITAIQYAMDYPENTLTLACVAPSPLVENELTIEGVQQIHECWTSAYLNEDKLDEDSIVDTIFYAAKFGVNDFLTDTVKGVLRQTLSDGNKTWIVPNFEGLASATIGLLIDRKAPSRKQLARISCPVKLFYCGDDLAQAAEDTEGLRNDLLAAGVDVAPIYTIMNAPHFGHMFFAEEINPIIAELILSRTEGAVPPAPQTVESPYMERLMQYMNIEEEDDDDDFYISSPVSPNFVPNPIRI